MTLYEYCKRNKVKEYLLNEWDYEKNNVLNIQPDKISYTSIQKVWWKCEHGHEWQAGVGNRKDGTKCPFCTNKKVLVGFNDLTTTHPMIANEWHFTKNELNPTEVTAGSSKKVWWKCWKGHEWEAVIYSRKISGCPYCLAEKTKK